MFSIAPPTAIRCRFPDLVVGQPSSPGLNTQAPLANCEITGRVGRTAPSTGGNSCRDQSHARPTFLVARTDNEPRTQNGHIRNDTRDASRRIPKPSLSVICRQNRVADDRACTHVTLRNLHGKEGVDGSSPSEGFANALHVGAFSFRPTCSSSNVRWVWSRLWSFQLDAFAPCARKPNV